MSFVLRKNMVLTSKDGDGIPLTIDNMVFVCNELCIERKDLEDRTPMIIREKTEKWKQRRKEQEKTSINMKKDIDTGFFL